MRYPLTLSLLLLLLLFLVTSCGNGEEGIEEPAPDHGPEKKISLFCSTCHPQVPPEHVPRAVWPEEIRLAFGRAFKAKMDAEVFPEMEDVKAYYLSRAPESLGLPVFPDVPPRDPEIRFRPRAVVLPGEHFAPAVSHLKRTRLSPEGPEVVLATDMLAGRIAVLRDGEADIALLAAAPNPAHVEAVDLDRDGRTDLLVADLGNYLPTNDRRGQVIWFRKNAGDGYTAVPLLSRVGRVADAQAADLDGDGDLDIAVAEFGWTESGTVGWLENKTTDWSKPEFVYHILDRRTGAIHVPLIDLDQNGTMDIVALISQEHEQVLVYLGDGKGGFRPKDIWTGPAPTWGSSGIRLTDLDGDGDTDILYTNGDSLDSTYVRPYHSVSWLENLGNLEFAHRHLVHFIGAATAVPADLDGDGDLDIVAASFLGDLIRPSPNTLDQPSLLWLEQVRPGEFVPRILERAKHDHIALCVADIDGDGDLDLITGRFPQEYDEAARPIPNPVWLTVWENRRR